VRRYADAVRAYDRALILSPDLRAAAAAKGRIYLLWKGNLDTLRAALASWPTDADLDGQGSALELRAYMLLLERKADAMLALVGAARSGEYQSTWHSESNLCLYTAYAHRLQGDERAAPAAFASALDEIPKAKNVSSADELPWLHGHRGLALAGLGRKADALEETRWVQRSVVFREDHHSGPALAEERAQVLAQAGDADAALDEIERLLTGPSLVTVHTLRLDSRWDPIRQHPRFQALLTKYGAGASR
jgi:tetratricopeptide (TPR) repeat protein